MVMNCEQDALQIPMVREKEALVMICWFIQCI